LLSILDHYNIQVENPMTILSQDIAREFLNATSAQDKYKVFFFFFPPVLKISSVLTFFFPFL